MTSLEDTAQKILKFLISNDVPNISENRINQLLTSFSYLTELEQIVSTIESFGFKTKFVDFDISEISQISSIPFFMEQSDGEYLLMEQTHIKNFKSKPDSHEKIKCLFFEKNRFKKSNSLINVISTYFIPHKKFFYQILYGVIVVTLLQFLSPFLMQLFFDKGIAVENLSLVKIVIIGLIVIQFSKFFAELIRSWLYLHIGIRINISMISDFITNILNLPIHYFNSNTIGDILQRIDDNKRIENFLTKSILSFIFNLITIVIFLCILSYFNLKAFAVFAIGNIAFILWVLFFWRIRKKMDMNIFKLNSKNQNILIQLLQSVQEIKLYNLEKEKRWDWEDNQVELFKNKRKMMIIEQLQDGVSLFINESKNYIILYICATSIIDGAMSFGMMIAIQYILGQTSSPIRGITTFIMDYQSALISFKRINDINMLTTSKQESTLQKTGISRDITKNSTIDLKNVTFQYNDSKRSFSLRNVNMKFETGKTTAIIGKSGSGKTTVLKLILKFYNPYRGDIYINGVNLRLVDTQLWRERCGALLQDSIIFNDSILNNITMGKDCDMEKVIEITKMADIYNMIESSANGFHTILNYSGRGLSQGQIQRLLIARLMYKNPDIVLLDEITSALDQKTEQFIVNNLRNFFKDKTVIIISHKISTVRYADNFIVVEDGKILEYGNHDYLMNKNGYYASLQTKE